MGSKSWIASKGVWGGIATVMTGVAAFFQIDVPADQINAVITSVSTAILGVWNIYARIAAKTKIGG